ncbi:hypothetical protein [Paenibacillus glacialis]|uniref:hypothetical protein n=1 Tax=Paenibacillus glacialis TaxID=494026 RepID=UPI001B808D67|nr:hypothetical protein [Paenibacillus glacialis]
MEGKYDSGTYTLQQSGPGPMLLFPWSEEEVQNEVLTPPKDPSTEALFSTILLGYGQHLI